MKKIYNNPTLNVIKIETHKMLAESLGKLSNPVSDPLSRENESGDDW